MKKILLFIVMLIFGFSLQAQNFGEFIVNSHISDEKMQLLYDNCDSLNVNAVFHYIYSDDDLMNEDGNERKRHIMVQYAPCGSINGVPLVTQSYTQDYIWDISKWYPLLLDEEPTISFDVDSYLEYLNPQETVLHFNIINIQNIEAGDRVLFALVEDIGNKQNVQRKMLPSAFGIDYVDQKSIEASSFWVQDAVLENCNVVVWVEKPDKTVVFSKEFAVENEYVNNAPTLSYELTCPNAEEYPTVLNWWYLDLTKSTDYEDDINGDIMTASIKWEETADWTEYESITEIFEYRFRMAGTYEPIIKLVDSDGEVVTATAEPITIDWISGVETIFNGQEIKIFPNPFVNTVNIESNDLIKTISVLDITGKKLFVHHNINNNIYRLETNNYQNGTYFIKIVYSDDKIKETVYKVLKN
jgi:hypothetical protein